MELENKNAELENKSKEMEKKNTELVNNSTELQKKNKNVQVKLLEKNMDLQNAQLELKEKIEEIRRQKQHQIKLDLEAEAEKIKALQMIIDNMARKSHLDKNKVGRDFTCLFKVLDENSQRKERSTRFNLQEELTGN